MAWSEGIIRPCSTVLEMERAAPLENISFTIDDRHDLVESVKKQVSTASLSEGQVKIAVSHIAQLHLDSPPYLVCLVAIRNAITPRGGSANHV